MAAHYPPRAILRLKLYVVHDSHPCAAVEKALALKGSTTPCSNGRRRCRSRCGQRILFGGRTVPGLKIDGEKVQGSRAIMRRLDELVPEPPLFPHDAAARARVDEAERWGDEVFQPVARELIWAALMTQPGRDGQLQRPTRSCRSPPPRSARSHRVITHVRARINRTDANVAARGPRRAPRPARPDRRLHRRRNDRRCRAARTPPTSSSSRRSDCC